MSNTTEWKLQGPVETLKTETATWDQNQEDWQPHRHFTIASFRPDGALGRTDTHNPDGTMAHSQSLYDSAGQLIELHFWSNDNPIDRIVYTYDEAGRRSRAVQQSHDGTETLLEICTHNANNRTKVKFLNHRGANISYAIEGTDHSYSAPGATTMTTTYDANNLPVKVLFEGENRDSLSYVTFKRDSAGRLLSEEMHVGAESMLGDRLDKVSPEEREKLVLTLQKVFGGTFSSTTYAYDTHGRLLERTQRMGALGEHRTTYRYDDHNNPIEETNECTNREASANEDGTMQYTPDITTVQHNRSEYRYDTHGNWTERIGSYRLEPDSDFQRSNIERRTITYHTE